MIRQSQTSINPRKIYETLFIKFDSHALQLMEAVTHLGQDRPVREELQAYHIELSEVLKNIEGYLKEVRTYFASRYPKSLRAVQLIVETIRKKCARGLLSDDLSPTKRAAAIISLQVNLQSIAQILQSAWTYEDDIASFPKFDNPQYHQTYKCITVSQDPNPEQSQEESVLLGKLMNITNAAVLTELAQSNSVFGLITFGISFPRFALDYETAQLRNNVFLRSPTADVLSEIWNLPQKGAISKLKYFQFEWIRTNTMLYIPRKGKQTQNVLQQIEDTIPVRLIYDDSVKFWNESASCSSCCSCCQPSSREQPQINQIILHFHGGGFISLSSCTTQSYTRRWSKKLKVPVLSVDYSMPPNGRFPAAVEDVLAVYKFITQKLSSICNINPKRIIITGDSAGGNLVCSLMGLIIKERLQQPSGLFLAYPAASLRICFSPSRLHSFFTPILHPSLLYLCLREYLGPEFHHAQNHPLASPLYLTKHFVGERYGDQSFPSQWPRTRIMVGDQDPLFDDSLRLCQRMVEAGIDVNCKVYKNMSHGFLSLQKVVARGEEAIVDSISMLREFLSE